MLNLLVNSEDASTPRVISLDVYTKESDIKLLFKQFLMVFSECTHLGRVFIGELLEVLDAFAVFTANPLTKILNIL